jgi:hypothetical protein
MRSLGRSCVLETGLALRLIVGSRLTGKHAIGYRAREIGITTA